MLHLVRSAGGCSPWATQRGGQCYAGASSFDLRPQVQLPGDVGIGRGLSVFLAPLVNSLNASSGPKVHRCFSVDEILRLLVCKLVALGAKATVAALACRREIFEDPLLDALWKTQNQLTHCSTVCRKTSERKGVEVS